VTKENASSAQAELLRGGVGVGVGRGEVVACDSCAVGTAKINDVCIPHS
jgi:hypothetical protein